MTSGVLNRLGKHAPGGTARCLADRRAGLMRSTSLMAAFVAGSLSVALPDPARAQATWVGSTSSDFTDGANWDTTPVAPGAGDTAIIDSVGTFAPTVSFDTTVDVLDLSASELTVDGTTLSIVSALDQSGGTLTSVNSGIVVTSAYTLTGGTLDADVDTTTFAQTGGTIGTGSVTSDIEVIAIGGTVTAIGQSGVSVTGGSKADISVKTGANGAIKNTAAGVAGINTKATDGDTTITLGANVEAEGDGIYASTVGTGDVTITGTGNVTGGSDAGDDGIQVQIGSGTAEVTLLGDITGDPGIAMSSVDGGSFTINGTGDVTGLAGAGITLTTTGGDGKIVVTQDGTITGKTYGVYASTSNLPQTGDGSILVTAAEGEAIVGETYAGVFTVTANGTNTVDGKGDISGVTSGVRAESRGDVGGDVTVSGAGKTSSSGAGSQTIIAVISGGGAGDADVLVDRSGAIDNTGTGATIGINASTNLTGDSDVTVDTAGGITIAGTDSIGIEALVLAGSGDAKVGGAGDIVSTGAGASFGIRTRNTGTGTGTVTVTGSGKTSTSGATSTTIHATGAGGDIIVDRSGQVSNTGTGATTGIHAVGSGATDGDVTVTTGGLDIAGAGSVGINAQLTNAVSTGTVTVNGSGDVISTGTGDSLGIQAINAGSGDVKVGGTGKTSTSGATSTTIYAAITSASGDGDVLVDRSGLVSNTGTGASVGINAFTQSTGDSDVTVTTGGVEIAGAGSTGIAAQILSAGKGDVLVNGSGDVTSTGTGTSYGIRATNAGSGGVTVSGTGKTSTSGATSVTIAASGTSAASGDILVDRSGLVSNTGTGATIGIQAATVGTGDSDVTVKAAGGIQMAGAGSTAISASIQAAGTGDITISNLGAIVSTGTGKSSGIDAVSASSGLIDIDSGAITLADASTGIAISATSSNGGTVTVDNAGALNGGATGIAASSTGAGSVTVTTGAAIGSTDAVSAGGITVSVVDGTGQANVAHDITSDGYGVAASGTGTGLIDINQSAGTITAGTIGIDASQSSTGLIDIDLTGSAAIDSAGIGVRVSGASTVATLDISTDVVVDGATDAVLSKAGTFTVSNSGTVRSAGNAVNVVAGTTTFNNLSGGAVFGDLASELLSSSLTIDNRQGATWTLNEGGTSTLAGADDEITNGGLFRASGNTTITGLESFTNQATGVFEVNAAGGPAANITFASLGTFSNAGTVDLSNGVVGDRVTLDGGYDGVAGSTINIDIDLGPNNPGGAPQLSDQLVVTNGAFTGTTNVAFNVVDVSNLGLQDSPIIVVDLDATQNNTGVFTATGLPALGGLVEYQFGQIGEDWAVTSTVNLSAAGGIAANISLAQSIIGTVVNRPSSPYVSGLAGNANYYVGPAVWMRGVGGAANASAGVSDDFGFTSQAEIDLTYLGGQVGADIGWFNVEGTDLTINAGITGGYNAGRTSQDVLSTFTGEVTSITDGEFDSRYAGIYLTVAKARYFADIQARFDRTDFTFNNAVVGLTDAKVDSDRFSVNGSVGYAASLGNDFTLVPSVGLSYAHTQTSSVAFNNGATMDPRDYDSWMGFAGATLVRTIILPDQLSAVSPFITGTIYNDFGDDPESVFTFGEAQRVVTTENIGTFGEVSLGADYVKVFATQADGKPLKQLNANLRGDFKFSDRLLAVGVNLQMRLQF